MRDFLQFKSFIAVDVLITLYYLGSVVMPIFTLYLIKKFRYFGFFEVVKGRSRLYFLLMFIFCFLLCEIFWRVGFEAIIGYFQMVEMVKDGAKL